jgi:hypothetical protein
MPDPAAVVKTASSGGIVVLPGATIHNGTIELEVAGKPGAGAPGDARGFVGVAFRVSDSASKYECFYLRPTNGRADDQLRRNHAVQYISFPDYEWNRLRTEAPGQYESYVDLFPGEWTKIKVEVSGVKARLYVHGASQPALIVNDLKLGDSTGAVVQHEPSPTAAGGIVDPPHQVAYVAAPLQPVVCRGIPLHQPPVSAPSRPPEMLLAQFA